MAIEDREITILASTYDNLKEENYHLKDELYKMKDECYRVKDECNDLKERIRALTSELETLKNRNVRNEIETVRDVNNVNVQQENVARMHSDNGSIRRSHTNANISDNFDQQHRQPRNTDVRRPSGTIRPSHSDTAVKAAEETRKRKASVRRPDHNQIQIDQSYDDYDEEDFENGNEENYDEERPIPSSKRVSPRRPSGIRRPQC